MTLKDKESFRKETQQSREEGSWKKQITIYELLLSCHIQNTNKLEYNVLVMLLVDSNISGLCDIILVVVQLLSHVRLFGTPRTAAHQSSLSFSIAWSLLKLMCIESVMPSNHLILCHPLLLLPSILPGIRVFPNEPAFHIRWSKNWSFSISPSNEYSGLVSFRIDWFDLLAVQGTLRNLL